MATRSTSRNCCCARSGSRGKRLRPTPTTPISATWRRCSSIRARRTTRSTRIWRRTPHRCPSVTRWSGRATSRKSTSAIRWPTRWPKPSVASSAASRRASPAARCRSTSRASSDTCWYATSTVRWPSSTSRTCSPPCAAASARRNRSARRSASSGASSNPWPSGGWSALSATTPSAAHRAAAARPQVGQGGHGRLRALGPGRGG
jgi:hypothetical protein